MKLFISSNNFDCCLFNCLLYFTMKDKPFRFFLWIMSFSVLLKQTFYWISFGYSTDMSFHTKTCFDFYGNLKVYKRILLKQKVFLCHRGLARL